MAKLAVAILSQTLLGAEAWVSSSPLRGIRSLSLSANPSESTKWRGPGDPRRSPKLYKPSWTDDFVEDLTNKRFGNGWAFYGERETLKNKDYDQLAEDIVSKNF